jgi:hypothetical protein
MIRGIAFGFALLLLSTALSHAQGVGSDTDGVFQVGEWKYQLIVLGQGTPDQKAIGKLSFKGKEVFGGAYYRIVTDLGHFMWSPYACDAARCGWYRIDPTMLYSRWTLVRIDESENGSIWHPVEVKSP